jgi:hypothetical protein
MPLASLTEQLEAADSLLDLAARLGDVCLAQETIAIAAYEDPLTRKSRLCIEGVVAQIQPSEWHKHAGGYHQLPQISALAEVIANLHSYHPLEHLAFLRGLCLRALPDLFDRADGEIALSHGLPIPFAIRPVNRILADATPFQLTLNKRGPLRGLGYELFRNVDASIDVRLDYGHRERLDALTWVDSRRLPSIATLHPSLGEDDLTLSHSDQTFFDVRPRDWRPEQVLGWLRSVSEHEIAVLPELSLPAPDALAEQLALHPERYPPLIVAGSAHVRREEKGKQIRANESHVYLEGRPISLHRKFKALETRKLGRRLFEEDVREGITPEPKRLLVLSGERTRLAVVICADLNEHQVPALLEAAAVNLLIVPTLTYDPGAFNATICTLASRCQAVCVVVNANLPADGEGEQPPFLVLASVPRKEPEQQSRSYRSLSGQAPPRGVFDPNVELKDAMRWEQSDGQPG